MKCGAVVYKLDSMLFDHVEHSYPVLSGMLHAHRITVQHVPPSIFPASYPCRIFSRQRFLELFQDRYEVIAGFDSNDGCASASGLEFAFSGMILRKL